MFCSPEKNRVLPVASVSAARHSLFHLSLSHYWSLHHSLTIILQRWLVHLRNRGCLATALPYSVGQWIPRLIEVWIEGMWGYGVARVWKSVRPAAHFKCLIIIKRFLFSGWQLDFVVAALLSILTLRSVSPTCGSFLGGIPVTHQLLVGIIDTITTNQRVGSWKTIPTHTPAHCMCESYISVDETTGRQMQC